MSQQVKSAEELLNADGFLSPLFKEAKVKVRLLTDDMKSSPDLQITDADGNTKFVIEHVYDYEGAV